MYLNQWLESFVEYLSGKRETSQFHKEGCAVGLKILIHTEHWIYIYPVIIKGKNLIEGMTIMCHFVAVQMKT